MAEMIPGQSIKDKLLPRVISAAGASSKERAMCFYGKTKQSVRQCLHDEGGCVGLKVADRADYSKTRQLHSVLLLNLVKRLEFDNKRQNIQTAAIKVAFKIYISRTN